MKQEHKKKQNKKHISAFFYCSVVSDFFISKIIGSIIGFLPVKLVINGYDIDFKSDKNEYTRKVPKKSDVIHIDAEAENTAVVINGLGAFINMPSGA